MATTNTAGGYTAHPRRPSWRGVLAGLLMGLIVVMAMMALALVLGSFLPFSLQGTSIAAGIYAAITAVVSAYVAGYFAVKCSAPEAIYGDGTDIDPKDATLTGMLTAAAILALTTILTLNTAGSILSTATSAATSAVGTAANMATSAVGTVASTTAAVGTAVTGAAGTAIAESDIDLQAEATNLYNKATGNISREDVEGWLAQNSQGLDENQISAAADVIEEMVNRQKAEVQDLDFTNLDTWRNIDTIAKQRLADIEQTLTTDEIITRLEQNGLTESEAEQVRSEVVGSYNEYKTKTEQTISDVEQKTQQGIAKVENAVDSTLKTAEEAARKAALYTGLFWLIGALLTFLASMMGARSAAAKHRLDKPIVRMGDNVR